MKTCLITFLKVSLWLFGFVVWIIGILAGGIAGAVISGSLTVLACCRIYIFSKRRVHRYAGQLSGDLSIMRILSEQDILCTCIADALLLRANDAMHPVARRTVTLRTVCTAVYLVLNALFIHLLYFRPLCLLICCILAVAYTIFLCIFGTYPVLCRIAKKQPDTDFDQVVRENTFNSLENPVCKQRVVFSAVAFILSVIAVLSIHLQPRWNYTAVDGGYSLKSYHPGLVAETSPTIPEEHNGQKVVSIGQKAFANHSYLQSITIPDTVLTIEKEAFSGCSSLETVTLSNSLQKIGVGAFQDCAFSFISLPDTLTELLAKSFKNCDQLAHISIPQGVTEIRANAFEGCTGLKSVQLHDGIIDIHANAFQNCRALEAIVLPGNITEIHAYTFENCVSLRNIAIPNGVTRIAAHAFYGCSKLESADIPLTVTEIGSSAFRLCPKLKQVQVAQDTEINERAFKESPTQVYRDALTSAQWIAAVEETADQTMDAFYCVVSASDSPVTFDNGTTVILFEDARGNNELSEEHSLRKLQDISALIEYLEDAKKAGVTQVQYGLLSPSATQAVGTPRFVYYTAPISDLLSQCYSEVKNDG